MLAEPVLRALAALYPAAAISLVTREAYHGLFDHHPVVGGRLLTLAIARHRAAPDLAVDLQNKLRTRLFVQRATRAVHWRKRKGWDLLRGAVGGQLHRGYREGPSQVERMARDLGLALDQPQLTVGERACAAAAALTDGGAIALCPAASRPTKMWPAARFGSLGLALRRAGHRVLVVGGPGEGALLRAVASAAGGTALDPRLPLDVLAAVLRSCVLAVCNDTGLGHLSAAVGTPTVSIFGPTAPGRWAPNHPRTQVLSLDPVCGPCSDHGAAPCRQPRRTCLEELDVERVFGAVSILLSP